MTPHALTMTSNVALLDWVGGIAHLTQATEVVWCEGSTTERWQIVAAAAMAGALLSEQRRPLFNRHAPSALRPQGLERSTFVCSPIKAEAGPYTNWMHPDLAHQRLEGLVRGRMHGSPLYVVPHVVELQPGTAPRVAVEVTNSYPGILSMGRLSRMGKEALVVLGQDDQFSRGVHITLTCTPTRLVVCRFPQHDSVWSISV